MKTQIKKQTWKYFWEQKIEEIKNFFVGLFISYSIVNIAGFFAGIASYYLSNEFNIYFFYAGSMSIVFWFSTGLTYWIKSNWKKAKERAEKDFKKSKNKK